MRIMIFGAGGSVGNALMERLEEEEANFNGPPLVMGVGKDGPDVQLEYDSRYLETDRSDTRVVFARFDERFGSLPDTVIVNLGMTKIAPLSKFSGEDFMQIMYVNTVVPFLIAREYILLLQGANSGRKYEHRPRMIFTCSMASKRPMRQSYAYSASKAALVMLVRSLAREFSHKDGKPPIDFFGVSPCAISDSGMMAYSDERTQVLRQMSSEEVLQYGLDPIGRRAAMFEVMEAFEFAIYKAPSAMSGTIFEFSAGGN